MVTYLVFGWGLGVLTFFLMQAFKKRGWQTLGQEIIKKAEEQAARLKEALELELKQKLVENQAAIEALKQANQQKMTLREEKLDRQLSIIEKKWHDCDKKEKDLLKKKDSLEQKERLLQDLQNEQIKKLELLAGLSAEEGKQLLLEQFKREIHSECSAFLIEKRREAESEAEKAATALITTAINRLSIPTISEVSVITVSLPNQEMKGRVIGREGRNIRLLEEATGVNFVIDDTPNAVVISGFDPVRKEIARLALKDLILDGRIHPTRINEAVERAQNKVKELIHFYGEEAALKAGSLSFHPQLIHYLGQLHFRYSFGQNVLAHSLEVSHLMGIMAAELGLNCDLARRIGLLHDLGKAVSHEMEGSHALIGEQLAIKYGESEAVANGIGCHHDERSPLTLEASLCSAADRLSGGRPGARSEALEHYLKRSAKLEQISKEFEGVIQAYAMHAGREVRILIEPEKFDDAETLHLARAIAKKIEREMSYSGKIKVTVIREKRAVEYAS
jgi:ribonuclease Y